MNGPSALTLIGGRWAVSLRVWVIVSLLMQIPVFVRTRETFTALNVAVLFPGIAGALALGVILLLADVTILRHRREHPVRGWLVILVWIVGSIIRFAVTEWAIAALSDVDPPHSAWRLFASTISIVGWMWLLTYYYALRDYYRQVSDELIAASDTLVSLSNQQATDHDELLASLAASVDQAVLPALSNLENEIAALDDRSSEVELMALSERAGGYSRQLVREVSHEIAFGDGNPRWGVSDPSDVSRTSGSGPQGTWAISTGWAPLLLATTTVPLAATNLGLQTTIRVSVGLAGWIICLLLLKRLQSSVLRHIPMSSFSYVVIGNLLAISVGTFAQAFISGPVFVISFLAFWSAAFVAGVIASAMSRTISSFRRDNERLAEQNARVIEVTAQRDASNTLLRQQVSQLLHGPVQGRLAAVALSLRLYVAARSRGEQVSAQATFNRCRALLLQVSRDIEAIASGRFEPTRPLSIRLDQLVERWSGLLELTHELDPDVESIVDLNPIDAQHIFSVVEEAVNNACSHGRARLVRVRVDQDSSKPVPVHFRVVCTDDGRGVTGNPVAGLGLLEVERLGGTWSLVNHAGGGACLTVSVPASDRRESVLMQEDAGVNG